MATQAFQLDPSLANLPPELLKKKYDELTPEERRILGFTRQASQQQFDDSQQPAGAPADFSGRVLSNPGNVQVSDDTDSGIPALRLPNGVQAETGAYTGTPKLDTTNPAQAQVLQPAMQTIGADFSGKLPPGAELETSPASIKLPPGAELESAPKDAAAKQDEPGWLDKEIPLDSYWHATEQGLQNIGRGVKQAGQGAYEMVKPPTWDEIQEAAQTAPDTPLPIAILGLRQKKMLAETAKGAAQVPAAIHDINQSPDPVGAYGQVAARTAGEGGGQALAALATEGLGRGVAKAAPKIAEIAKNVTPKQAAKVVGGTGGGVAGHGTLSAPGAYYGAKYAGDLTETVLGRQRANSPIFGEKPQTAAIERDATLNKRNIPEFAGEEESAPKQTTAPTERDATRQNKPFAGEYEKPVANNAAAQRAKPETVGTAEGAARDTALFQQAKSALKEELGTEPTISQVAKRAQELKTEPSNAMALRTKPLSGTQIPSPSSEAYKSAPVPEGTTVPEGDMTDLLQKSLDKVNAQKAAVSLPETAVKGQKSGVMTTAEPGMLADRWGASEKSIADTDAQLRGKNAQESQAYIDKLAESYKKGQPVQPVMETRDANNNIIEVDGRHRALAAKKAGVERIPIIVRRLGVTR